MYPRSWYHLVTPSGEVSAWPHKTVWAWVLPSHHAFFEQPATIKEAASINAVSQNQTPASFQHFHYSLHKDVVSWGREYVSIVTRCVGSRKFNHLLLLVIKKLRVEQGVLVSSKRLTKGMPRTAAMSPMKQPRLPESKRPEPGLGRYLLCAQGGLMLGGASQNRGNHIFCPEPKRNRAANARMNSRNTISRFLAGSSGTTK